ncbi:MAG: aspartate--tRNA ligase [Deltaproteobacteria bacterium]|nr:aspartate--tRNA ligase [Deltaproteobacteria bacterium]
MVTLKSKYRTQTCAELRKEQAGQTVNLAGWIHRKRDHGGVLFIDLRDNYGITQVVASGNISDELQKVRVESVIQITGEVRWRAPEAINTKLPTGEIEVHTTSWELLSSADVLPFQVADDDNAPEPIRLKYRFLDLRKERLHETILLRSRIIRSIRESMYNMGFTEFQTPILTSSSPEGARDFLVPSRMHPGKFYALPQAPQQFKQLLMVSGFDRYFQIAACFRDEDSRADRSPGEFYQLDLEMSFVEQDQVFEVCEQLFTEVFPKYSDWKLSSAPFERIAFNDAMMFYGSDKPDLRIKQKLANITEIFSNTGFEVFKREIEKKGIISALKWDIESLPSRKFFDDTIEWFKTTSGQGLAYLIFENGEARGSIAKFMNEGEIDAIKSQLNITGLSVVFMGAGAKKTILPAMGQLRVKLGEQFNAVEPNTYHFCWIVDFPMFEEDPETQQICFSHNPFSMPQGGMEALETKHPLEIFAYQYDLVCNGVELSSGAVRNHRPDIMYKAFSIAGYPPEVVDEKFGGMNRAFRYGAPPHAGIAPGIDRIVRMLAQEDNLRKVIAFPMAQSAEDLLMGAPSTVAEKQLRELHIALKLPKEKEKQA